jgi:hypothetical protein
MDWDMSNPTAFRNKCPQCGNWLEPNESGPCPKCGAELFSAVVAGSSQDTTRVLGNIVNNSGDNVFVIHNIQTPEWWPEVSKDITRTIEQNLPEIISKYEKKKEADENRLAKRLLKVGLILFWIIVGAVLSPLIARLLGI